MVPVVVVVLLLLLLLLAVVPLQSLSLPRVTVLLGLGLDLLLPRPRMPSPASSLASTICLKRTNGLELVVPLLPLLPPPLLLLFWDGPSPFLAAPLFSLLLLL